MQKKLVGLAALVVLAGCGSERATAPEVIRVPLYAMAGSVTTGTARPCSPSGPTA